MQSTPTPFMRRFRPIAQPLALLGAGLAIGLALGIRPLDVLPLKIPVELSLRGGEIPSTYTLLASTPLMDELGMNGANPGYIANVAESYALSKRGGLASFAALYGREEDLLLILNGVYFRNREQCDAFIEHQRDKDRKVVAYRKRAAHGDWLIFIACDPSIAYSEDDLRQIRQGLSRYQRRLQLDPVFDALNPPGENE